METVEKRELLNELTRNFLLLESEESNVKRIVIIDGMLKEEGLLERLEIALGLKKEKRGEK